MTTEELLERCDRLEKDHACCPGLQHIWNANGGCQWCHQDRDDVDAAIIAAALRSRLAGPDLRERVYHAVHGTMCQACEANKPLAVDITDAVMAAIGGAT